MARCSLCGRDFDPACQWCRGRAERLRPATPEGAASAAEDAQRRDEEDAARAGAVAERLRRLEALGRPVRVGLVACAKLKREGTHPAREIYKSPLFRLALGAAERACDEVFILSALHELVELAQPLQSYDRRLGQLDRHQRALWGSRVSSGLEDRFRGLGVELHAYAGREYLAPMRLPAGWRLLEPLRGMSIGARLRFLSCEARPVVLRKAC